MASSIAPKWERSRDDEFSPPIRLRQVPNVDVVNDFVGMHVGRIVVAATAGVIEQEPIQTRAAWPCTSMLESAKSAGKSPRQLSFTAALHKIGASWVTLPLLEVTTAAAVIDAHVSHLESHEFGHRPNRVEPRAIKRRPKPHKLLTKPRDDARAELLAGQV